MTDFGVSWTLSRQRFNDSLADLSHEQLNWKLSANTLSIGEMALHVAGVEVSFASQLTGLELNDEQTKLAKTATDGVVNDKPFPYELHEITAETIAQALAYSRTLVEPRLTAPTFDQLHKEIQSALGPIITGQGALARLAFHPAYHQGQVYLLRNADNFPA